MSGMLILPLWLTPSTKFMDLSNVPKNEVGFPSRPYLRYPSPFERERFATAKPLSLPWDPPYLLGDTDLPLLHQVNTSLK